MESKGEGGLASMPSDDHSSADHVPSNSIQVASHSTPIEGNHYREVRGEQVLLMISPYYKEEDLLIVRVKRLQSNDDAEKDEKIPKQEAVCRFCFYKFENDNVLKTKCKCKFTLIHQECAIRWFRGKGNNKCNVCDQDIQNIPVLLLTSEASRSKPRVSTPKIRGKEPKPSIRDGGSGSCKML